MIKKETLWCIAEIHTGSIANRYPAFMLGDPAGKPTDPTFAPSWMGGRR